MTPFRAGPTGYVAGLEPSERIVLAQLAGDVAQMLQDQAGAGEGATADPEPDAATGAAWAPPGWTGPAGPVPATSAPRDPAVRRLLPDASDDEEVAAEFRRFTQADLADEKVRRLVLLAQMLVDGEPSEPAPFVVARDVARRVVAALTDVRLVLADRLELHTDEQVEDLYDELAKEAEPDDDAGPRRFLVSLFLLTGLLQESLVEGMLADLRSGRP
ncbi:DUF2017 family protein [Cellulosimicrobium terreum]|nr:DUF2017 family protein [Cellulosimicrobium terreum]